MPNTNKDGVSKMKRKGMGAFWVGVGALGAFIVWTLLVRVVDVRAIGPMESAVGFATLNGSLHALTGVHPWLYTVTDWLGLVPFGVAFGFAVLGLVQWIRRGSIRRVDRDILVLGGFYVAVIVVYALFEVVTINARPVLIEGVLETSYPSSTTMLVLCVMSTAFLQLRARIKGRLLRRCVLAVVVSFAVFMVVGRFVSGVHWTTDIVGGALISAALVSFYAFFAA